MKKTFQIYKIGKILAIIFFVITICIISLYFFLRDKNIPTSSPVGEKFERPKFQESITHFEIKGGKRRLSVRGERHYLGEDGRYHLENNIEIKIFPKKEGGKETVITAQKAIYNEVKTLFTLLSDVTVKQEDFTLKSQEVIFNRNKSILRAKSEIQIFSPKLEVEGRGLVYFIDDKTLKILSNVAGKIKEGGEYPINFQCNRLEYMREEKRIFLKGKVTSYQHFNGLKSNQAVIELDALERELKSINLLKNAKITLVKEDKNTGNPIEIREMKANGILIYFKNNEINSVHGKENCSLKISSENFFSKEIRAHEIELFLKPDQTINFKAKGNVFLRDVKKEREITAGIIIKDDNGLSISGDDQQKASISFENNKLSAQKISIDSKSSDILAEGGVENIIYSSAGETDSISFLSPSQNISISSEEMSYMDEKNIIIFEKNVQLRQGKSLITCEKISIDNNKKIISAEGKVRAFLYLEQKNKLITILSERMEFNDSEKNIIFRNNNFLSLKNLKSSAEEIKVFLKKETEGIEYIEASDNIRVSWRGYHASGDAAEYFPDEEKFILSNNVTLLEKGKSNEINGSKLTFYLSDDRIMMENKEGRITTILKSSKK